MVDLGSWLDTWMQSDEFLATTTWMFIWGAVVTIATVIFLNYPAPDFSARLEAWFYKGKVFQYKGHDIFYIDEKGAKSDGSVLLCIHGFPTSSHDWMKLLGDLTAQYDRVILVDMLGYGFSDKPKGHKYRIEEQADILETIVQSLSIPEINIISHDYGDTVALELLHRHNNNEGKLRIRSLCMLNGGVFPETNTPRPMQHLMLIPYVGDIVCRLGFYRVFKKSFAEVFGKRTQPSEEELQDFYATIRHKDGHIANAGLIVYLNQRAKNKDRWVGALQKTTVPVHMIFAPSDKTNKREFIEHYKKTVPSPSIDVLEEHIGHYPQWEAPDQVMNSYKTFLKRLETSRS